LFDLHIIHCIKNGLKYYKDNQSSFNQLFNDIGTTLRDNYFARLGTIINTIQVDMSFNRTTEKFPLIAISLSEAEIDDTNFIGNVGNPGTGALTELNNQECRITIYSNDMNDIRLLHRLIRGILLLFKKSFFKIGYTDMRYIQSKDLKSVEIPTGSGGVVYIRELLYTAQTQLVVKRLDLSFDDLPWSLNPSIENF
jgi:hypothetical protein